MGPGGALVREVVAHRLPRLTTVVRALDDLAEPAARLRGIQPLRGSWRPFDVVDLPAPEVRPVDVPLLAGPVGGQDEGALARSDQYAHPAHDRSSLPATRPTSLYVLAGRVAPRAGASASDFRVARPASNWLPIMLSMLMKRPIALATKFFSPDRLQVTAVCSPSGLNVNSAVAVDANGFTKSSWIRISSFGRLSVMVMRPSPTLLLPDHAETAPTPAAGPLKVYFAAGSSFAQGFHVWNLRKSLTWANRATGGAAMRAVRVTR